MPRDNIHVHQQLIEQAKKPIRCTQCGYEGKPDLHESSILGPLIGCPECDAMEGYPFALS